MPAEGEQAFEQAFDHPIFRERLRLIRDLPGVAVALAMALTATLNRALAQKFSTRTEQASSPSLFALIDTYAYYCNPCEWWAYSRDGNWPPPGKLSGRGWTRPIVRPLQER
jgi:hypothetical protein